MIVSTKWQFELLVEYLLRIIGAYDSFYTNFLTKSINKFSITQKALI